MKNNIAIIAKYHGPTNNKGSRFSLSLPRWNNKRINCSWQYEKNHLSDQCEAWFAEKGLIVDSFAEGPNNTYIYFVDFEQVAKVLELFKVN